MAGVPHVEKDPVVKEQILCESILNQSLQT
jgi:hypothetical protein